MPCEPHVIFVALGSRGDVQPLAVLATQLSTRHGGKVTLVSHGELEKLKEDPSVLGLHVCFRPLTQPCFVRANESTEIPDILDLQGRRRAEWVEAITLCQDADILVCNLFAMPPVYHLSERLGLPWLCCSPSLIPYAMPPGFEEQFAEDMPDLMEVLKARDVPGDESLFSWSTVKTWLWPIFTESHAILREEFLGLPPVPGDVVRSDGLKDRFAPETLKAAKFFLGIPQTLMTSPSELPPGSIICGSWTPGGYEGYVPPEDLERFFQECDVKTKEGSLTGAPFYIGFGSMGAEGLIPNAQHVVKVLLDTAKWMARPVVLSNSFPEVMLDSIPHVFCCSSDVPHPYLLPRCALCIHHGGIGTVIACARAKRPQMILPLAFDQPFWGQCLEELGIAAVQDLEAVDFSVVTMARKLRAVLTTEVQQKVNHVGDLIMAEDGTEVALKELEQLMKNRQPRELREAVGCGETLRPVHPISVRPESGPPERIYGRSSGEVQFIFREIAEEHCYGLLQNLPSNSIVIDGGLNLGIFSLILSQRWSGDGSLTVLAFEPAIETYHLAIKNLRNHQVHVIEHGNGSTWDDDSHLAEAGTPSNGVVVHCFQMALSDHDGEDQLCYFPYLTSSSTLAKHRAAKDEAQKSGCFDRRLVEIFFAQERLEDVRCVRLSTVLQFMERRCPGICGQEISLLKLDIEGAEDEALRGLEKFWPRVKRLAVEVHGSHLLKKLKDSLMLTFHGDVWQVPQELIPDHFMLYGSSDRHDESTVLPSPNVEAVHREKKEKRGPLSKGLTTTSPPPTAIRFRQKRLLNFILERQRRQMKAQELTEPFLLLLPSWTVGKAFFRKFLSSLAQLKAKSGEERAAEVFYLCRRGAKGRPEKYAFHHVEGAGLARCPFFGLWICGGFGEATEQVCAAVLRRKAEGFWDGAWYTCRPREVKDTGVMRVHWEDGTESDLQPKELRGGLLLFRDLAQLEKAKLLRSTEEVKRRQEMNPKQKLRLERAVANFR
eukprot:symbB.v1.2.007072.t1/scaffold422.1/size209270/1